MPIWNEETLIWIGYECSRCGESGRVQVDATQMQGACIEVFSYTCPNCGTEMYSDSDEWDEGEDYE